jgi:hypothetical protein
MVACLLPLIPAESRHPDGLPVAGDFKTASVSLHAVFKTVRAAANGHRAKGKDTRKQLCTAMNVRRPAPAAKPLVFAITARSHSVKQHASMITDPVTMTALINRTVVLPKKARMLLCATCLAALQQERVGS